MKPTPDNHSAPMPLFLHIPKTGGTTLKHCIFREYASERYYRVGKWLVSGVYYYPAGLHKSRRAAVPARVRGAFSRKDIRAVTGHFSFGIDRFISKPCTYVTLLRNPVDRLISLYYHIRTHDHEELHEEIVSRNLSLEEFVADLSCREADNDQTRRISGLEPKFGAVSRSDLAKAKANLLEHFSIVGVTERFDETVVLMKRILAWTGDPVYRAGLVNQDRPKASALAQRTIDIVLEYNQLDLELWEFARTLLLQRVAAAGLSFQDELDRFRVLNADYCAQFSHQEHGTDGERSNTGESLHNVENDLKR